VPHHLIDIIDPPSLFGRAVPQGCAAPDDGAARGKLPLLVGGTMLYFKVLAMASMTCPAPIRPACAAR
jgi:tRNA dimethylallyltransferase